MNFFEKETVIKAKHLSELNNSIDHAEQMEKKEDTIHHTSKITDVNQDDPEIKTAEAVEISHEAYLKSAERGKYESNDSATE